jgi:hypothetical protein
MRNATPVYRVLFDRWQYSFFWCDVGCKGGFLTVWGGDNAGSPVRREFGISVMGAVLGLERGQFERPRRLAKDALRASRVKFAAKFAAFDWIERVQQ